jgi:cation diffusion facilitator family transporter
VGISVALVGGEGYESADDYAALFAAAIIGFNAFRLVRPALQEIMDAAPPAEIEKGIRAVASAVPGVHALDKCFVRKMGLEYFVDLHVIVEGEISVLDGHEIGHNVKDAIIRANPGIADVLVHVEPTEVLTNFRKPKPA